jgi:hypothetical protein
MKDNELECGGCPEPNFAGLFPEAQKKKAVGSFMVGSKAEHKMEHNNCRMRGPEFYSEASVPTVSP